MKTVALQTLVLFLSVVSGPSILIGQSWRPMTNEHGDTLRTSIVIADSNYVRDEVIFFFKDSSLNKAALCHSFDWVDPIIRKGKDEKEVQTSGMMSQTLRLHVMSEKLSLASVINDAGLVSYLQSVGGQYFTRITAASPCSEQKSITRRGDTIPSLDHCYYLLKLSNDTSVPQVVVTSILLFGGSTYYAQPNFKYTMCRIPDDSRYADQKGLQPAYMNVQKLWDLWTGLSSTLVAVIDDGIDFTHCEFGPNGFANWGDKVVDGYNYVSGGPSIDKFSGHGTPVASIIGAYTNRATCGIDSPKGMAGIAGGWGPLGGGTDEGGGVKLLGLKVGNSGQAYTTTNYVMSAIREAAGDKSLSTSKHHNAWAADVIMLSAIATIGDGALHDAVMYARSHDVPIIVPSGNTSDDDRRYPAAYGDSRCILVGAGDINRNRIGYSNYQDGLDLIAPGGDASNAATNINIGAVGHPSVLRDEYKNFAGTSAAAPNVAGIVAALHNNLLVETESGPTFLAQEDYEGLLAATANDRTPISPPGIIIQQREYLVGYDKQTGWGHADAGKIVENKGAGYVLRQYDTYKPSVTRYGPWSNRQNWLFSPVNNGNNTNIRFGNYLAEYRQITAEILLPDGWDRTKAVYVWGRGGQVDNGFDLSNPNYAQGFTRGQANQELGNGLTEPVLLPDDRNVISLFTFQMRLYNNIGQLIGVYPADGDVKYSYTVYGVRSTTSVEASSSSCPFVISPNPVVGNSIGLNGASILPGAHVRILSAIGEIMIDRTLAENEHGHIRVDVNGWPSSVYFAMITSAGSTASSSFIIAR
jgi:hypothetical protein